MNNIVITKRRKVNLKDCAITPEILEHIVIRVYEQVKDINNITQREIIKICLNHKLSSSTIARVIKDIIPNSKATSNSVNGIILRFKKEKELINEILRG